METSLLWQKLNYTIDVPYITSSYITEYDLSKANINALLSQNAISEELYNYLLASTKEFREIYIGNMIKNDIKIYKAIQDGIIEAKRLLFESNNILDHEVFAIRNDAVFFIGNRRLNNTFGRYQFKVKNIYSFAMNTTTKNNKLQILYNYDQMSGNDIIDIKGISDDNLIKHSNHILQFMCSIFYGIVNQPIENVISEYNEFYDNYINRRLDIGYYREFDQESKYRIIQHGFMPKSFLIEALDNSQKMNIDINCNLSLLRDIGFVLHDIYLRKVK